MEDLAAIFADRSCQPSIMHSDLPSLVSAASFGSPNAKAIRLVPLPAGSEARLKDALAIPRVGLLGISRNAPEARAVLDFVLSHVATVKMP